MLLRQPGLANLPECLHAEAGWQPSASALLLALFGDQLGERDAQRPRDGAEVEDTDVALAPFDVADEGAVRPAALAQLSLGQVLPLAVAPDPVADGPDECLLLQVHAGGKSPRRGGAGKRAASAV